MADIYDFFFCEVKPYLDIKSNLILQKVEKLGKNIV